MTKLERKVDLITKWILSNDVEEQYNIMAALSEICDEELTAPAFNIDREIEQLLFEIGVPSHLKGFKALMIAIRMKANDPENNIHMTKNLYPDIAKELGGNNTPARVERCIRHSIESAFDRVDSETIFNYFGSSIHPRKDKPTNSEFISRMAIEIRNRMEE